MTELKVGTKVFYTGDVQNSEGFGVIVKEREAIRFGPVAVDIRLDDGREIRGIGKHMFNPEIGRRFWPLEEWLTDRKAKIEAMQNRMRELQAEGKV